LQEPPKCTQIAIFGLKINHLATLITYCAHKQETDLIFVGTIVLVLNPVKKLCN
jgi:hypothetical protein